MNRIYKVVGGALQTNSYVVTANDKDCIIIDCCDAEKLSEYLKDNNLICRAVLLTHVHFDHCGDAALLQNGGAKIYVHENDVALIDGRGNLAESMGFKFISFRPDVIVRDGDIIDLYGIKIKVIHTPGHTGGSVCYLSENTLFSGDTLFRESVGRTDFLTGSREQLSKSIREKLFALKDDCDVLPGHGEPTRLFFERSNNVYV